MSSAASPRFQDCWAGLLSAKRVLCQAGQTTGLRRAGVGLRYAIPIPTAWDRSLAAKHGELWDRCSLPRTAPLALL